MRERVAVVGAGVSGLTCGVLLAERGFHAAIFAAETTPDHDFRRRRRDLVSL